MRLSQIARKLGVAPSTVSELLVKKGYDEPKNGNAKLNEDQVSALYKHYDITVFTEPEVIKELASEEIEETEEGVVFEKDEKEHSSKEVMVADEVEQSEPSKEEQEFIPEQSEVDQGDITEEPSSVEVIRAKKVKLEGIKVLGKIELPKPVEKKVGDPPTEAEEKSDKPRNQKRSARSNQKRRKKRPELTIEQKQAAQERKRIREKKQREQRLKEKKQAYFQEKIRHKQKEAAAAAQKRKKKKEQAKQTTPERTKINTKNPFKRFWLWLNDPYA